MSSLLDARPLIVAVAGSNGAGKTTFYRAHLASVGLRYVNADVLAIALGIEPYAAARVADSLRRRLVAQGESFVFETVLSDPVGEKIEFLKGAVRAGYTVVVCFIGISSPKISDDRVAMRVSQGGHDVPMAKLIERFPRTLVNLGRAIRELPRVWVFDNDDLAAPFRNVAVFENGRLIRMNERPPAWLDRVLP